MVCVVCVDWIGLDGWNEWMDGRTGRGKTSTGRRQGKWMAFFWLGSDPGHHHGWLDAWLDGKMDGGLGPSPTWLLGTYIHAPAMPTDASPRLVRDPEGFPDLGSKLQCTALGYNQL